MEQFIADWANTTNASFMSEAYFHAMEDQVHTRGHYGIEPSILNGYDQNNYPYAYRTYANAKSETGSDCELKLTEVYGIPSY